MKPAPPVTKTFMGAETITPRFRLQPRKRRGAGKSGRKNKW
jgi:hypothetical protein